MKTVRYAPVFGNTHAQVPALAPYMTNGSQICQECRELQDPNSRPVKGGFHIGDEVAFEDDVAARLLGGTVTILGESVTFAPNPNFIEATPAKTGASAPAKPPSSAAPAADARPDLASKES